MIEKPKCTVIGCRYQCAIHLHHRKKGITYYSVCARHLKEIKQAYLKEDIINKFTI